MLRTLVFIGCALFFASSCSRRPARINTPPAPLATVKPGYTERGIASWYGEPYHGRRAANGEVYNMRDLTAAHLRFPFGTWVEVLNESNGKHVQVRITDRGPYIKGRIIDLSQRAAEDIALIGPGVAPVRLTVIKPPRNATVESYGVQLASFTDRARATSLRQDLLAIHPHVRIVEVNSSPRLFRVIAGEGTKQEAEALARHLRTQGHTGFVTRHVP